MRIRILKAKEENCWYKDRIGTELEVLSKGDFGKEWYRVQNNRLSIGAYHVWFEDCEIINEG